MFYLVRNLHCKQGQTKKPLGHETDEELANGIVNDEPHIPYTDHGTGSMFNAGRLQSVHSPDP